MRHALPVLALLLSSTLSATESWGVVPLAKLLVEGEPIASAWEALPARALGSAVLIPVRIDGGTAVIPPWADEESRGSQPQPATRLMAFHATSSPVRGTLVLPEKTPRIVRFTVPAELVAPAPTWQWRLTTAFWYRELLAAEVAGGPWFHQRLDELGISAPVPQPWEGTWRSRWNRDEALPELMGLVGGGRAVAENLALDRPLDQPGVNERIVRLDAESLATVATRYQATEAELRERNHLGTDPVVSGTLILVPQRPPTWWTPPPGTITASGATTGAVAVGALPGIEVAAVDWSSHGSQPVPVEPVATIIPQDQHAVLAATLVDLLDASSAVDRLGTPIRAAVERGGADARISERYRRQLCLESTELARLIGPSLIRAVAITGSDAYLRSGTDVAVIFEPIDGTLLTTALTTRLAAATKATKRTGTTAGIAWTAAISDDRSVCAYLATIGGQVVVTNSLVQLTALAETAAGKRPALTATDDYRFFRTRYPRSDGGVLVVLSDATIRRWCSARWRIGDARRQLAAARLVGATMAAAEWTVTGRGTPPPVRDDAQLGRVDAVGAVLRSSLYGTVGFQTPIAELDLDRVTSAEADAYRRWLDNYRLQWRRFFDPIGIRLRTTATSIALDTTVVPLSAGSDLREFLELTRGGSLTAGAGDPHPESLAQLALGLDLRSRMGRQAGGFLGTLGGEFGADPLRWIGSWASLTLEPDDAWLAARRQQREAKHDDSGSRGLLSDLSGLPVVLHVPSTDPLALTVFLTAVRGMADQSAPGLVTWQVRKHGERSYVAITPEEQDRQGMPSLYYATLRDALILSLNEGSLTRAMVRHDGANATPWPGQHVGLRLGSAERLIAALRTITGEDPLAEAQRTSWANLPLLDELRQRFPDQDPITVWQRLLAERPDCPGGGTYGPDANGFMASSVYGSPAAPRDADHLPAGLASLTGLVSGLTFEADGLRARVELGFSPAP